MISTCKQRILVLKFYFIATPVQPPFMKQYSLLHLAEQTAGDTAQSFVCIMHGPFMHASHSTKPNFDPNACSPMHSTWAGQSFKFLTLMHFSPTAPAAKVLCWLIQMLEILSQQRRRVWKMAWKTTPFLERLMFQIESACYHLPWAVMQESNKIKC